MPARRERPVSIAIVNDYELVVVGLAALLAEFADRVRVGGRGTRVTVPGGGGGRS